MKRMTKSSKTVIYTPRGYLRDVWEEWDEVENFDFTDDPMQAYNFRNNEDVPKYLGVYGNVRINNIQDACKYLDGHVCEVDITVTTEFEVRMVH